MVDVKNLVDVENATQAKKIFWDQDIYDQELERIFGRSWLFLSHDSLIPKNGDFVTSRMGEDKVIVSRQKDGSVEAFINSCSHRGNQVCHADSGNAKAFTCNYHGWVFGQNGDLVDVPLDTLCYHDNLKKSELGLRKVRVESYKGLIFGNMDPDAISLEEYLGDMCWFLDSILVGAGGGMELMGPPLRSVLDCNWKVPAENFVGDGYHVGWTHAAALQMLGGPLAGLAGNRADMPYDDLGKQFTTRHGHGFGVINESATSLHPENEKYAEFMANTRGAVAENLGKPREELYMAHWNSTIFPNCSFLYGTNTFKIWHPIGPGKMEVWTYTLVHKDLDIDVKRSIQRQAIRTFGTAGTLESDDGENMSTCTDSNRGFVTRKGRMNSTMGINRDGRHPDFPGIVGASFIGETSYRGFYRFWAEIMDAPDWEAIKAQNDNWDEIWRGSDFWSDK